MKSRLHLLAAALTVLCACGSGAPALRDDAGPVDSDAGVVSFASDAGVVDAGSEDSGVSDAGFESADAGDIDAGLDAGDVDAGATDAGVVDALETYDNPQHFAGVPQSTVWKVVVTQGTRSEQLVVFEDDCPTYQLGSQNMTSTDQFPLNLFKGRSISWANFSFSGGVTIEATILDTTQVAPSTDVNVYPRRSHVTPAIAGNTVTFTLDQPGQYSVEVGRTGYQHGLMIFANPMESNVPDLSDPSWLALDAATPSSVASLPANVTGLYFKDGIHDVGVFTIPPQVKNVYLSGGAWVYGALHMDGNPGVHIFGRGVLSSARLDYRQANCVEAVNGSDAVTLEGIVIDGPKFYSVRLIGQSNVVSWIKVIGSWTYNTDGISAFAGSTVSHCFVWSNDDNIKAYRSNVTFQDMVLWQLNNGAAIQLGWAGANSDGVIIQHVDLLHAEWNNNAFNRGVLAYVGNHYQSAGSASHVTNFTVDDLVTETQVPVIFRVSPDNYSPATLHGLVMKDWRVKMDMSTGYVNYIVGPDPSEPFDGVVFDNFVFNGSTMTASTWMSAMNMQVSNLTTPTFQ